jgi:hypothetical protein
LPVVELYPGEPSGNGHNGRRPEPVPRPAGDRAAG